MQVRDYPQFDPNVGMLNVEETHEETEIELNENEPLFLRGQVPMHSCIHLHITSGPVPAWGRCCCGCWAQPP